MTNTTVTAAPASGVVAKLSIAAIVAYQIMLLTVIFIKPEVDPARKPVSEYAMDATDG
jgi:hypothetical protein